MQKRITFYHNKNIDMLKLGCTLPNLTSICSYKSTDAKFYPFTDGEKTCCRKLQKTCWVDHPLCSRVKQSLTKPSFGRRINCANKLLVLMRVNCIHTQCVNLCQQDFKRVGILIRRTAALHHDKTRPTALRIWSFL